MSTLRGYMNRSAPTLSVSGLRQSRRLEGQFSHDVDRTCYSEVVVAMPLGAESHSTQLRVICRAITAFQRDAQRGSYDLRLLVYGAPDSVVENIGLGYKSTAGSLLRWVAGHVGEVAPTGGQRLEVLPKAHQGALVVIVQAHAEDTVSQDVLDALARHPRRQIVWGRLHEQCFYTGREAPPQGSEGGTTP